jgi:putative transposase
MPRLARLPSIPFGYYYVALHSVTGRKMITNQSELTVALQLMRETLRKRGARLHGGYVAEREAHLALQVGEVPLSVITGVFQHEYARFFNRSHHEQGSLFRLHCHVLLIEPQRWLVPLVHFIHWLPRLQVAEHYPSSPWWSSDAAYRGTARLSWVTTNVVLRMLRRGAYNRQAQEQAYRRLFDRAPESGHAHSFKHGSTQDARILGGAQFITDMWRLTGRRPHGTRHRADLQRDIPAVVTQIIERFDALCQARLPQRQSAAWRRLATLDNVRSKSRKRPLPMVRALSASYLIEQGIATATRAARFFGCAPRSVSARRRRFYAVVFRERFGASPEILFGPALGDPSGATASDHCEVDSEPAPRCRLSNVCTES